MRILICGDRNWDNRKTIKNYLLTLPKDTVIIEGEAPGADTIAREEAEKLGMEVIPFEAKRKRYGRGAGPIRNQKMLDEGKPDEVVAFHPDINNSKGTLNMIKKARKAGIPVKLKEG